MILFVVLAGMAGLALVVPVLSRRFGRDTGYFVAGGFVLLGVLLAPSVADALRDGPVEAQLPWLPALGVSATLRLDGLASLFALLVIGVGALIMAYCPRYLHGDHHARTYVLLTLFAAAMLGLVLAADLVLLFVFWELTTVASFFLIGGTGPKSAQPAMRALIITGSGGLALLVAVILIAVETGTTYLPEILANPDWILDSPYAWPVGLLLILAALTKSAQLPFQSWLPGAMVAITPVSAYLHAATMVKAGIYLLMRFSPVYAEETAWQAALITVGLLTAVVGAALALRQHDLKSLLAYSTVSQLGLLVAVTGVGTTTGLTAAVLHTLAHALFKATLFMLVGIIDREAGSRDVRELGGLRRVMPVTAALTGLAGLSMAGVPPFIGFVSKETIFQALAQADVVPWAGPVAAGLGVTASALTFAYGVRIFHGAFAGPTTQRQLYEPAWQFLAPAAVPAVLGLLLGPGVSLLDPLTGSAVADMAPGSAVPHVAFWHGFSGELLLSAITIAIGMALFLARDPVDHVLQRVRTPPEGELFDRGYHAAVTFGWWLGRPSRANSAVTYLAAPVAALVAVGGLALLLAGVWPAPGPGTSSALDWPLVALLAVTTLGVVLARQALAAVALLGLVGLLMSVWFLLAGAPDVALTLLLAEVLTAVAVVLVLRALAPRFRSSSPRRMLPTAALAVGAGVVATAATLAFTGHRDRSRYAEYFLSNAESATGGVNVVNTILIDFRALDTLGEATVLGMAALGLVALLGRRTGSWAPVGRRALGLGEPRAGRGESPAGPGEQPAGASVHPAGASVRPAGPDDRPATGGDGSAVDPGQPGPDAVDRPGGAGRPGAVDRPGGAGRPGAVDRPTDGGAAGPPGLPGLPGPVGLPGGAGWSGGTGPSGRVGPPPLRLSNQLVYRVTGWVVTPAMLLLSAYLFLRGHYAPGGGFIAALVAGAAIAFGWIAYGRAGGATPVLRSLRTVPLVGGGVLICVAVGLAGLGSGDPFLTPLHADLLGLHLSSSLLFDLGVYLLVLGLIVATVDRLSGADGPAGTDRTEPPSPLRDHREVAA